MPALHPDRFFPPDPTVRAVARELYAETAPLPLVCPHGHVEPALLADDAPFPEPTALLLTPDHYVLRMLHSQGVPLEDLGVPRRDGAPVESDPRAVWRRFAERYDLFLGTPSRAWLDFVFAEVFEIEADLSAETADAVYDAIDAKLKEPSFRPRALFDRFGIEVLTTTDGAADRLEHHETIRQSDWNGRVVPSFRPDAVFQLAKPGWQAEVARLGKAAGADVGGYADLIRALEDRRAFFKTMGATSTDHGVGTAHTERLEAADADALVQKAFRGEATAADQAAFEAHMLMEMARMSVEDGLVMQIHPGVYRDHDAGLREQFGPNLGGDIPLAGEFTRSLRALLNAYGSERSFRLVVFTLDESTYARELAPLAGHYPAMRLGPAWWFHDSVEGMRRYRERTTETAGIFNTAGFNDDTRAFLSIPARHDLSRRVDAGWLAGLVAEHRVSLADAHRMAHDLAVGLARDTYRLGTPE